MNDLKSQNGNSNINPGDCETLSDLLPAYAFGFCDPEEMRTVERLLPQCPGAVETLAEYTAMAQHYLRSVPMTEPPASLLGKLMAAAEASTPSSASAPIPVSTRASVTHSERQPSQPSSRRFQSFSIAVYTAFAAAIVLLFAVNVGVLAQISRLTEALEGQSNLLSDFANDTILTFQLEVPEGTAGNADANGNSATNGNTDQPKRARAVLHCNPDNKAAIIRAEHFPPAEGYQVWLWRDGQREKGGTLNVDSTGTGTVIFEAPEVLGRYQYVSIAPPEGEPLTPVVRGNLYAVSTPYSDSGE